MKVQPTDPANMIVRTIPAHPESATIVRANQVIPDAAVENHVNRELAEEVRQEIAALVAGFKAAAEADERRVRNLRG